MKGTCLRFYLTIFICLFQFGAQCSNEQNQVIDKMTADIKQAYDAEDAYPEIKEAVYEILNACGISESVIVLQSDSYPSPAVVRYELEKKSQFYIIVSLPDTLNKIKCHIYHEIGHIVHGDVSSDKVKQYYLAKLHQIGTLLGGTLLYKYAPFKSRIASGSVALVSILAYNIGNVFLYFYKQRLQESKADEFAYEKMLEHNKLDLFIERVAFHLERQSHQKKIPFASDPNSTHPTDFDRTKMGLEILQAHGYNIAELMQNLPESVNSGIKKHLPGAVKKYFPEFL